MIKGYKLSANQFLGHVETTFTLCSDIYAAFDFQLALQAEDGGVSRDELTAVLLSSLESAQTILENVEDAEQPEEGGGADKLIETVTRY